LRYFTPFFYLFEPDPETSFFVGLIQKYIRLEPTKNKKEIEMLRDYLFRRNLDKVKKIIEQAFPYEDFGFRIEEGDLRFFFRDKSVSLYNLYLRNISFYTFKNTVLMAGFLSSVPVEEAALLTHMWDWETVLNSYTLSSNALHSFLQDGLRVNYLYLSEEQKKKTIDVGNFFFYMGEKVLETLFTLEKQKEVIRYSWEYIWEKRKEVLKKDTTLEYIRKNESLKARILEFLKKNDPQEDAKEKYINHLIFSVMILNLHQLEDKRIYVKTLRNICSYLLAEKKKTGRTIKLSLIEDLFDQKIFDNVKFFLRNIESLKEFNELGLWELVKTFISCEKKRVNGRSLKKGLRRKDILL